MPKATKQKDRPHARIYQHWLGLPAWNAMRNEAQLLLLHMMVEFRPSMNSRLEWSLTRVQEVLRCSRSTASECLTDLEENGWIKVCRVGTFSGGRKPSLYRLTMFPSEVEDLPKTEEFLRIKNMPRPGRKKNLTGSNKAAPKFHLKPEQVLVETAKEEKTPDLIAHETAEKSSENNGERESRSRQPQAQEKLRSQLLLATAAAPPPEFPWQQRAKSTISLLAPQLFSSSQANFNLKEAIRKR